MDKNEYLAKRKALEDEYLAKLKILRKEAGF